MARIFRDGRHPETRRGSPLLLNGVIPKSGVVQPGEGSCAGLA